MANVTIGDLERVQSISDSDLVEVETSTRSGNVEIGQLKQYIISDVEVELSNKVDKVAGKGLSTNDFTDSLRDKLATLEGSRYKGDYLSIDALRAAHPTASPGDYANVDVGVGERAVRYIWDATDDDWVDSGAEATPLTAADVKALYESNPDTNSFDDTYKQSVDSLVSGEYMWKESFW